MCLLHHFECHLTVLEESFRHKLKLLGFGLKPTTFLALHGLAEMNMVKKHISLKAIQKSKVLDLRLSEKVSAHALLKRKHLILSTKIVKCEGCDPLESVHANRVSIKATTVPAELML